MRPCQSKEVACMQNTERIAICYDFDHTLSPDDMQAYSFIPSVAFDKETFWAQSNADALRHHMDRNLAWMKKMLDEAIRTGQSIRRESFMAQGQAVELYPGLTTWFDALNAYGAARGITVEHYIISSGLKEMIEGTSIARQFARIYASTFLYDAAGQAVWPAQVVNYTNKTQFIYRIAKGTFDENDERVNQSTQPDALHVPYENMIYIGDSDTDIPSMRVVKRKGGVAIGVYDPKAGSHRRMCDLFLDRRIDFFAPADYAQGAPMHRILTRLIDLAAARHALAEETRALRAHVQRCD